MANADIQLLFGVLGDGSLSGESGSLIQEQLTQIVSALNKNPLKVKVALDTEAGGQKSWSSQVQTKLNTLSTNGKFSVQISKLGIGAGAISDFKKQLNAVINTLNLDKGTSITLSAEGIGEVKRQVKDAGDSASEAARKTAEFRVQLEALAGQKSAVQKALTTLGNSVVTDEERTRLAQLTTQYEQWAVKIETIRASKVAASSETQAELIAEGNAIRENISALVGAAHAAKERADAEQAAAQGAAEAETARMATLNEVVAAYKKINDYINKNPRIANTSQHAELVSMRNELESIWKSSAKAEDGLSGISKVDLRNVLRRFSELDISLGEAGKKGRTLAGVIESAYKKFGGWMLVTRSLMAAVRGIKDMVSNVTALDAAMTELRKVTDATEIAYNRFFDTASTRAKKLGATFVDTISASADFARLGYSLAEASDLADAALVYKNVGDGIQDVGEASESIISTMKAFGIEAANAMNIVDKFNEVGNNFAISSKGVGDALVRSAAALAAAGNTLDESIALITAANNVVQNPEKVGTTLKTVSMFLRAAKTEAEEAGESTDGMANSVSELRKELLALTGGKLDIQIDEDTFKSTYQIIKELSEVWGELTDISQANILEMIGGKRNSNVVAALLTNFESAEEVLATAADSAGPALSENEKYLDSINGKVAIFQASFEKLSATFISSGFVKGVVDFGTSLVETLTFITEKLGSMPALIAAITGAITIYSSAKNKTNFGIFDIVDGNKIGISSSWIDAKKNIAEYNKILGSSVQTQEIFTKFLDGSDESLASYVKSLNGGKATMSGYKAYCKQAGLEEKAFGASSKAAAIGVTALNVAMNMLISLGISLLLQGIVAGLDALINAASIASDKANELADSTREQATASKEEVEVLDDLVERYKKLRESEFTDADARTEIRNIQDEIVKLVGAEAGELDLVNGKLDDTLAKLREKQRLQAETALDSAKAAYNAALDAENKAVATSRGSFSNPAFGEWAFVGDRNKTAEDILRNAGYGMNVQSGGWFNSSTYISDFWSNDGTMAQGAAQKIEVIRGMIAALKEAGDTDSEVFTKLQQQYEAYDEYLNKTSEAARGLLDATYATERYSDTLNNMTVDSVDTYNAYRDALIEAIKNNDTLSGALEAGDISNSDITAYVDDIMAANYPAVFNEIAVASGNVDYALTNLAETITELQSAYDLLETAQKEMAEGTGLSASTISALAQANENYIDYLYEENGVVKLNTEAWKENANAKIQGEMLDIEQEIASLVEQNRLLAERNELLRSRPESEANTTEIEQNTQAIADNTRQIQNNQGKLAIYGSIYGSITGDLNAYTSALNNFANVATTIDSVAASYASLANLQKEVANGFTLSLDRALEYARVYPEILNSAKATANGELALNEAVVNSFISGKQAELATQIDSEIAKLEADKAVLAAKMENSKAQLELVKAVATGEGQLTKEVAEYRINTGNALTAALIEMGVEEANAYALATAAMAGNEEEFARVAMECFQNMDENAAKAAYNMARAIFENAKASSMSIADIAKQAHQTAHAIAGMANGVVAGSSSLMFGGAQPTYAGGLDLDIYSGSFEGSNYDYEHKTISLDGYIAQLQLDISSYEDAISQIDGQIATLEALKNTPFESFKNLVENASDIVGSTDTPGSSSGGSSGGSSGSDPKDEVKDAEKIVEEYIAAIDEYYEALKRLEAIQERRKSLEKKLEHTSDLSEKIFLSSGLINIYQEESQAEQDLMAAKKATIAANVGALRMLGFQVEYNNSTNELYIRNLEHLNQLTANSTGKYDTLQEATNALRKETEELIDVTEKLNEDNIDAAGNIEDLSYAALEAKNNIIDYIEEIYEKQSESYQKIIDLRKELIQSAKDEYDYESDIADKVKEIAELQSRIDQLSLDSSRSAQAERNALIQELQQMQKELADTQSDHSMDAQTDALDKMAEDFETNKQNEIELLRGTVDASEELWNAFYQTILGQNVSVGSSIDTEIAGAWIRAAQAVNEYSAAVGGVMGAGTIVSTIPRYHDGGIVSEKNLGNDEALAILQTGEAVLNDRKQQSLYRIIDFQAELSKRLGVAIGEIQPPAPSINMRDSLGAIAQNLINNSQSMVFEPRIEVVIHHNGEMSDASARSYGNQIADITIDKLYGAFERRGINSTRGSRLKP